MTTSPTSPQGSDAAEEPGREVFAFDRFRVDVATCECWQDGDRLHLTGKVFDTLVVLLRHRDRVVTKEELIRTVWRDAFVSDDSLTQVIRSLRRSLGDHATNPAFISTIPGRGYRFVAAVHPVPTDTPDVQRLGAPETKTTVTPGDPATTTPAPAAAPAALPLPITPAASSHPGWSWPLLLGAAVFGAIIAAVGVGLAYTAWSRPTTGANGRPLHLSLDVPAGTVLESGPAISPDGTLVTFVASSTSDPSAHLWVRDLATGQSRVLDGTHDPVRPFWSPDSKEIAFFENGSLRVTSAAGGSSRPIVAARNAGGGSWGESALLISEGRSALYSVSLSGHTKTPATTLDDTRQEVGHRWPQWLPDQQHFLYYIESANAERSGTYVGSAAGLKRRLIDAPAVHTPGYLIFVQRRVLFAQRFDEATLMLVGEPTALDTNVTPPRATTGASISVSHGTIAYGGSPAAERLVWFDRTGQLLSTVDAPAGLYNPSLASDQSTVLAATDIENGFRSIWRLDLKRGEKTRVAEGMRPMASPDGAQVAFTTDRTRGVSDIYLRTLGGEDRDDLLVQSTENKVVTDWSADSRFLIFSSANPSTRWDLWRLPMQGLRRPEPFLASPFNEIQGQVSDSNRWMAYSSDETGTYEVYIRAFPTAGNARAVSVGGGTEPHWRRDEREIFYLAPDRSLMAVSVTPTAVPQLGTPTRLFRLPIITRDRLNIAHYDVTADGQRFLVHTPALDEGSDALKVLVNWTAAVQP